MISSEIVLSRRNNNKYSFSLKTGVYKRKELSHTLSKGIEYKSEPSWLSAQVRNQSSLQLLQRDATTIAKCVIATDLIEGTVSNIVSIHYEQQSTRNCCH